MYIFKNIVRFLLNMQILFYEARLVTPYFQPSPHNQQ